MNDNGRKGFAPKTFDSGDEAPTSLGGLLALNRMSVPMGQRFGVKHVYAGTVPANVKHHRRAKNKMARKSRRANRG